MAPPAPPQEFVYGNGSGLQASDLLTPPNYAVWGDSDSSAGVLGTARGTGVLGAATDNGGSGVFGTSPSSNSQGVLGLSMDGYGLAGLSKNVGVYARNYDQTPLLGHEAYLGTDCCAGDFKGPVYVSEQLWKAGGGFQIDHPEDPANKYLFHSFVESSEMKNVYDGTAVLGSTGKAVVKLPAWFQLLNREFRYQLTAVGRPAPGLHIAKEMANNQFSIAGGSPKQKISWQLTGIRQDPWARANRLAVETKKPENERGSYLHPAVHGQPRDKGVHRVRYPNAAESVQKHRWGKESRPKPRKGESPRV